ncbi:MAG TPA: hypothetical protein VJ812_17825 [Gemmatimonadaceae bacterium]|jgi:hypothetical protein|nr:hypothetical protein [Gemmatimonadaceae bacterium]
MSDDLETPPRAYNTPDLGAEPVERPRRRRWKWILVSVLLLPALLVALWTVIAMAYTYSSGERVGYVQKFSKKGWLCKTWEGELALSNVPGQMPEKFYFTVRDDSVAKLVQAAEGGRVALHYRQHVGIPFSCIGETQYFVDAVRPARQ